MIYQCFAVIFGGSNRPRVLVVVQAYSRSGGEWLFGKSSGGRLLTRSSKFLSDHLMVQVWSVELVAVVAKLVVVVLLGLSRLGAEFGRVVCGLVLSCVCGALKCASRMDFISLGCQPMSLYLGLE